MEIAGKVSHSQLAVLVYGSAMGNIIYTFTEVTSVTGRPFWVAMFIGVLLNIPFAIWILALGSYKKDGTLFDLLEDGLGRVIGRLVLLLYFFINIAVSVGMLNLFTGTVKVFFLPRTPAFVILLVLVFMCAVFTGSGLNNFARLVVLLCILATVNYFAGFSLSFFRDFKIEFVTPVFDSTYLRFFKGVMLAAGSDAESLLFLMVLVGAVPQTQKHYAAVIKGFLGWAVVLSVAVLVMEAIDSQELLSSVAEAGITVASTIQVGSFFSGLEIFILITYQYIAILKIVILLYSCWICARKFFNVPQGKPLLVLSALAMLGASAWLSSYNRGYYFSVFLGTYILPPFVLLTLLLGTVSVFIKKHKEGKSGR